MRRRAPCGSGCSECNGACVDTGSDPANCGACGVACPASQTCEKSACVELPGLVAFWKMDALKDSFYIEDASGQGNDLTLKGKTSLVAAHLGKGLSIDDVAQDSGASSAATFFLPEYTVSLWVQQKGTGAGQLPRLINSGRNFSIANIDKTSGIQVDFGGAGGYFDNLKLLGQFHHVVASRSFSGECKLYYDGQPPETFAAGGNPISGAMIIGFASYGGETFNGIIDQVRVYNRVLTGSEVVGLSSE